MSSATPISNCINVTARLHFPGFGEVTIPCSLSRYSRLHEFVDLIYGTMGAAPGSLVFTYERRRLLESDLPMVIGICENAVIDVRHATLEEQVAALTVK